MKNDLICFSHLGDGISVYQRPQHLMSRAARSCRVFYFEEPVYSENPDQLRIQIDEFNQVIVVTPELCQQKDNDLGSGKDCVNIRLAGLVDELIDQYKIRNFIS